MLISKSFFTEQIQSETTIGIAGTFKMELSIHFFWIIRDSYPLGTNTTTHTTHTVNISLYDRNELKIVQLQVLYFNRQ